jgi:hypothetical protein
MVMRKVEKWVEELEVQRKASKEENTRRSTQ